MIPIIGRWTLENPGTISLGQGVVHYPPPSEVFQAITQNAASDHQWDRYGNVTGDPQLLERISEKLRAENGFDPAMQTVVCSSGANMAFLNAVLAIAD
ncbi:MAG: aminotransferase class I/II-fold pyridoxal phosphate-dependent enzyme, partial [Planctomycetota bacterium]